MGIQKLINCVGLKIESIKMLVHVIEDEIDHSHPLEVAVVFDNREYFTFSCASDGQSIDVKPNMPLESEMGEYGCNILKEVPIESELYVLLNEKIIGIKEVYSNYSKANIGYALIAKSAERCILNLGDELFLMGEIPNDVIVEEALVFRNII